MHLKNDNSKLMYNDFRLWLKSECYSSRIISNYISRLRRLQLALAQSTNNNLIIEEEFKKDKCATIFNLFRHYGENEDMRVLGNINLPIGKVQINVIKHSLKVYCQFLEEK